jgi:CRP/FNR family cyclic AMP-dependent transcriptional regulator
VPHLERADRPQRRPDERHRLPLFGRLEDPMLVAVANGLVPERFPADHRLFSEGDPGDRMFAMIAGEAEVFREADGGRVVLTRCPGEPVVLGTRSRGGS